MPEPHFLIRVHRHYWWVFSIVLPLTAVALGLFLAMGQAREHPGDPSKPIEPWTIFAVCVALGALLGNIMKLLLDRSKEEHDRKEKEDEKAAQSRKDAETKREVVTAWAGATESDATRMLALGIQVLNGGQCKVHIQAVYLVLVLEGRTTGFQMVRRGERIRHAPDGFQAWYTYERVPGVALEPKETALFKIEQAGPHSLRKVLEMSPDEVWVVVSSTLGEVSMVPGSQIQEVLRAKLGLPTA